MVYEKNNDSHKSTDRTEACHNSHFAQEHELRALERTNELHGETATDEDDVSTTGLAMSTLSDDLRLEVTCGQNQAILYTGRLQLGSKGTCVLFENAWLTPNEFQYVSGRETAKDWKRSIKHHGKSLKVLIAKGILSTTPPARCSCSQCTASPKKDSDTWTVPGDSKTLSSSVVVTKLAGHGDVWQVTPTKHANDVATDGSAFRPPTDIGVAPDTTTLTNLYSSHNTKVGGACDGEELPSPTDKLVSKKAQKRSRSPADNAITSQTQSKFLATNSQQFVGSTPTLTAVPSRFPSDESRYNVSRQQLSLVDNERRTEDACSLTPLRPEHQSSVHCSKGLQLFPQQEFAARQSASAIYSTSPNPSSIHTSHSCVISPLTTSPYLPFFTPSPSTNMPGLCYPNPYVMLPAPLGYQQTRAQLPCGWMSSGVGSTGIPASEVVAEQMWQLDSQPRQQLYRGPSSSVAFDFPWMRGTRLPTSPFLHSPQMSDLYESHLAAAAKQSLGFNQYMHVRNVSNLGLGAPLVSDGLDMYRQSSCDLSSRRDSDHSLLDSRASYLGLYSPLFQPPYLGIPSR